MTAPTPADSLSECSPLPWSRDENGYLVSADGKPVFIRCYIPDSTEDYEDGEPEANTKRVVVAVNSHPSREKLVGELCDALDLCEVWLVNCVPTIEPSEKYPLPLPFIRALLARARKE